ncbi:MAG: L-lactate permease [Arachnia sp.]
MPLELVFQPPASPLGNLWLAALVASLPIIAMVVTLAGLRWKAYLAGPFSWFIAFLVAVTAFQMPWQMALATSAEGFVYGIFPIVWILLSAIWMYEVTVTSGRFDDLRRTFFLISDDPRVLAILISFCFGGLLEALAGYGAPVAITAAMLVAIGFAPLRAALIALLANTVPVAFGAVGLPVMEAARVGGFDNVLDISPITGRLTAMLCLVVPFLLLMVIDGKRGLKQCWPFGLVVGISFGVTKWIVSALPLYNLTEMIASVVTVGVALVFLRLWRPTGGEEATARIGIPVDPTLESSAPKPATSATEASLTPARIVMALVPYILVIIAFGIAAIPAVKQSLVTADLHLDWPLLEGLRTAAGDVAANHSYAFKWASSPGLLLALVAITSGLIYKMSLGQIFGVLWTNIKKMRFAMLTIGSVVALAYVMGDSGQTLTLGSLIAGAGIVFPFLSPVLGWLGTYVTGSDTSANILFSKLQATVGEQISPGSHLGTHDMQALLVGASASGGVVGKMISPQSLTVAATAIGIVGAESTILRRIFGWSLVLLALLCLLAGLMSTPVLSWLLP